MSAKKLFKRLSDRGCVTRCNYTSKLKSGTLESHVVMKDRDIIHVLVIISKTGYQLYVESRGNTIDDDVKMILNELKKEA